VSSSLVRRFLLVGVCLTLSACANHERRYDLEGRVVSKVPATRTLVVDHENIPGFMAAMTMPYPVASGVDLSGVEAGDRIALQVGTGLLAIVVLLVVMNWFFHKMYWTGWISLHNRKKQRLVFGSVGTLFVAVMTFVIHRHLRTGEC